MKYCVLIFLSVFSGKAQKLDIAHLTGDFYIFTTYREINGKPFPSNGMYVVTSDGVVMLDSPWDQSQCQPLLDEIHKRHNEKVIFALATHYHDDRTGGFDYFTQHGIATWSGKKTYDLAVKHNEPRAAHRFKRDTVFSFGQHRFKAIYPGPGHTPDNIVVWFPDQKVLYGGCLVKSVDNSGLGNLADANLKTWPKAIKKVIAQCPEPIHVIPGHFGWADNSALHHTVKLLKEH